MHIGVRDAELALDAIPRCKFVMTAQHENRRSGVIVKWVAGCSDTPPLISVSLRKGHWIVPLIRDSRAFALCSIAPTDRLAQKKFAESARPRDGDQFDVLGADRLTTGAPVLPGSALVLDCEVSRHIDLEADHELYIGLVVATRFAASRPVEFSGLGATL
ncbi:MAG: flavin reductase family protein [Phycisphaerales bacterium]